MGEGDKGKRGAMNGKVNENSKTKVRDFSPQDIPECSPVSDKVW